MVGKPKLFLFDTCRGMRGLYTPTPTPRTPLFPSIDSNVSYPVYTDMLIISSTTYGDVTWTWSHKPDFVSTLCDVFSNLTLQHDIPQLFTLINGRVLTSSTDWGYPQMPQQSVMLTKFFRLSPIPLIELYKAKMYSTKSFCSRDTSVDRENLHWPNGITHSANVIIIADGGNHRIVVFTIRGNFSHSFRHPYYPDHTEFAFVMIGTCLLLLLGSQILLLYSSWMVDTSRISGALVRIKDNLTDQRVMSQPP